jgi:hypothetical protein
MVHLVSVGTAFHARVIAARLGSDGILTELRGAVDGPYPGMGEIGVYVDAADAEVARELLLADEVEAAFDAEPEPAPYRLPVLAAWVAVLAILAVAATWMARGMPTG